MSDEKTSKQSAEAEVTRWRALFEQLPDGLVMIDPETGRFRDFNSAAHRQLGYSREEFAELSIFDLEARATADEVLDRIATVTERGSAEFECVHRAKAGELRTVNVSAYIADLEGQPIFQCVWRDVTERTRAEEQLRLQSMVLDQISDHVTITDLEGVITYVNQAQVAKSGRSANELVGSSTEIYGDDPERGATQKEMLETTLRTGRWRGEVVNTTASGEEHIVDCRIKMVFDEKDRPVALCGVSTDVTERKKADTALRVGEERFRKAFELNPAWVAIFHLETGRFVEVNREWSRLFGFSRDEVVGRTGEELGLIEPGTLRRIIDEISADHPILNREMLVTTPSGEVRTVLSSRDLLQLGSEPHVVAMGIDITERKRTEQALQRSESDLRRAQRIARLGNWSHDLVEDRLHCSDEMLRIFGVTHDGSSPDLHEKLMDAVHPGDRAEVERVGRQLLDSGINEALEYRVVHADGTGRIVYAAPAEITSDPDGRAIELNGVVLDVTDQRKTEDDLAHARKLDSLGRLAGGIAHDFNNQLTPILGYSELLVDTVDDPATQDLARQILTAATRASDLTRQLLAFSRKGTSLAVPVDLHAIITEVAQLLEHSLDKRIAIYRDLRAEPHHVLGDPSQLQSALLNLAVNARDAMPEGGLLTFSTTVLDRLDGESGAEVVPGPYLRIAVSDSGVGMSDDILEYLFEPFFTTKEPGRGTGLGLAAVHGAVRNHHGTIRVESRLGHGSTFFVHLPVIVGTAPDQRPDGTSAPIARAATVLVVDDEPQVREMSSLMLTSLGYRVETAADGAAAVDRVRELAGQLDVIVLDLMMPRMNGRDAFRLIRELDPRIEIIICSGHGSQGEAEKMLTEGARAFIQKPFSRAELARQVAEALETAPDR